MRIIFQVTEALANKRRIVSTWANAVENLRQRNNEINQIRKVKHHKLHHLLSSFVKTVLLQELKMLKEFSNARMDYIREKQEFLNAHLTNSNEVERELKDFNSQLSYKYTQLKNRQEVVKILQNQVTK